MQPSRTTSVGVIPASIVPAAGIQYYISATCGTISLYILQETPRLHPILSQYVYSWSAALTTSSILVLALILLALVIKEKVAN